jgi:hypothetical protein
VTPRAARVSVNTPAGVSRSPLALLPQHSTAPSARSAQLCRLPAEALTNPHGALHAGGVSGKTKRAAAVIRSVHDARLVIVTPVALDRRTGR